MRHGEGDFREKEGAKSLIAKSVAEMVGVASISFSALRYPGYYQNFIEALQYTIAKIPAFSNKQENAQQILDRLIK